ncbi:penicillin acylase family protein [Micromonospora echinospora]|uniref:penicillin acylase family protein n=1 Tax=Micromonospora echinospora TaxID=1877 RepID=UPI003CEE2D7C
MPSLARIFRRAAALVVAFTMAPTAAPAMASPRGVDSTDRAAAVIRYTEYGIPHIAAANFLGLGYGYGYASAKDNLCTLADGYLTVDGERSRHFGPHAPGDVGFGRAANSLNSDLYFGWIRRSGTVDRLVRQPAPIGPAAEVREMVRGYVRGYNRYLADTGGSGLDPRCRGAAWVRPIDEMSVYRFVYGMTVSSGMGSVIDGIVAAAPAAGAPGDAPVRTATPGMAWPDPDAGLGSNAIAVGSAGTASGTAVLLANPHYPWQGPRRFWQSQLTIPGRVDVSGAGLLGFPAVMIGHNRDVAWSHTVSTPATVGLFELPVDPTTPTRYLVDGAAEAMTGTTVEVTVRQPDGSTAQVARTIWSTRHGPVVTAIPGFSLPWTTTVHTLRDANATNLRAMNTWLGLATTRNTDEVAATLNRTQGVPWLNTLAVDRRGRAFFGDVQVVPHVTDDLVERCSTALGRRLFPVNAISVLDGSRTSCDWGADLDAVEPGLLGPSRLPTLTRTDYVTNANDSPWLTNPEQPLTGYPRILGPVATTRSARTQESIVAVQRRLAGTDGLAGRGFSLATMRQTLSANHSRVAELTAADTVAMCAAFPGGAAPGSAGPVDVTDACPVLDRWDGSFRTGSRGALLFARFVQRLGGTPVPGGPWRVPFDPADPVRTPRGLAGQKPEVQRAFADTVAELRTSAIPLDAPLGDHQAVTRNGRRLPVPGAPHALGVLNVITPVWQPGAGNVDVTYGSSFVQVVELGATCLPKASSLLTYSQSSDPSSAHAADQTALFSAGEWVTERFSEAEILHSPALRIHPLFE